MCGPGVGFRHGEHRAGGILGHGLALCAQGDFQPVGIDGLFAVAHSPDDDLFGVLLQCSGLVVVAVGALGHIRQGKAVAQGIIGHLGLAQGRHGLDAVAGVIVVDRVVAGQSDGLADQLRHFGRRTVIIRHRAGHLHNAQIVPDILVLGALVCNAAGGLGDVQPVGRVVFVQARRQFFHLQNIAAVGRYGLRTIVIFRYHIRRGHGKADVVAFPVRVVSGHIRGRRHLEAVLLGKVAGGAVGIGVLVDGRPLHSVLVDGDLCAVRFPGLALGAVQLALHRRFHRGHAENAVFFRLVQLDLGQVQSACGHGIIVRHVELPGGGGSCRLAVGHHGAQGGQQVAVGVGGLHGKSVGVGRDRVGHGGAIAADLGLAAHGLGGFGDHQRCLILTQGGIQGVQVFLGGVVHPGPGLGAGVDVVGPIIKQITGKEVAGGVGLVHRHPDGQVIAESVHQRQGVIDGLARPGKVHRADGRGLGALDDGLRVADLAVGAAQHGGVAVCRAGHHVEHQCFALVSFQVHDGPGVFDERGAVAIRRVQLKGFAQGGAGGVGGLHLCPQLIVVHAFIRDGRPADLIAGLFGIAGIHGEHLAGLAHLLQAAQHGIDGGVGRADALGGAGGIAGDAQAHFIKTPAVAAARKVGIDMEGVAVGAVLVLDFAVGIIRQGDGLLRRRNYIAVFIPGFGHTVQRQLILGVAAAGSRLAGLGPGKGVGQLVVGIERIGRIFCQLGGLHDPERTGVVKDLFVGIRAFCPVAVVGRIGIGKVERRQVAVAVAAVILADDLNAVVPGRRAGAAGNSTDGLVLGSIPAGGHVAQAAVDRHGHNDPAVVIRQGLSRQVGKGKGCIAAGHRLLTRGKGNVLAFQRCTTNGCVAGIAAHQHDAVGGQSAADRRAEIKRSGKGQVVDGAARNADRVSNVCQTTLCQAGVAAVACGVHGGHIDAFVILGRAHVVAVPRGCLTAQGLAGAKAAFVQRLGGGVGVGKGVGIVFDGAAVGFGGDRPIRKGDGAVSVGHQGVVFVHVFQHQYLAEAIIAVLDKAHFQLGGWQGLVEVFGAGQTGGIAVALGVDTLDFHIEAAGPILPTLKGKALFVDAGPIDEGIALGAVRVDSVNTHLIIGRLAGGGLIPGEGVAAVGVLGIIALGHFQVLRCAGAGGIQQVAVIVLQGFVGDVGHGGVAVVAAFIKQQQDFARVVPALVTISVAIVFSRQQALAGGVVPVAVCFAFQADFNVVFINCRRVDIVSHVCIGIGAQPCSKINMAVTGNDIAVFIFQHIIRCIGIVIFTGPQAAGMYQLVFTIATVACPACDIYYGWRVRTSQLCHALGTPAFTGVPEAILIHIVVVITIQRIRIAAIGNSAVITTVFIHQ